MNTRHLLFLALYTGAIGAAVYDVRCDTVADGCESDGYISVETLLATATPSESGVSLYGDSDGFGVSEAGLQQVGDYFDAINDLRFYDFNYTASPLFRNVTSQTIRFFRVNFEELSGFSTSTCTGSLTLEDCYNLTSLAGFADMTAAYSIRVQNCASLTTLEDVDFGVEEKDYSFLQLRNCPALQSAPIFSNIVGSAYSLEVVNTGLTELNVSENVTIASVNIHNNAAMTSVSKLYCEPPMDNQEYFHMYNMTALVSFGGADFAAASPRDLYFGYLPLVNDFTVSNMAIGHNFVVFAFISVPCDVNFEAVVFQEPPTIFYVADTGITDFAGVTVSLAPSTKRTAGVTIRNNPALTQFDDLAGLFNEGGSQFFYASYAFYFYYDFPALGFDAAQGLKVTDNDVLTSLGGLSGIHDVNGVCYIANNPLLTDTSGLKDLNRVKTQSATSYLNYYGEYDTWPGTFSFLNNGGSELNLTNLHSVARSFNVVGNADLVALDLTSLTTVNGYVNVTDNNCAMSCEDLAAAAAVSAGMAWASTVDTCSAEFCNGTNGCNGGVCVPNACGGVCNCTGLDLEGPLCNVSHCGNGVLEPSYNETCDDGNNSSGDGCSANCTIEYTSTSSSTSSSSSTSTSSPSSSLSSTTTASATNSSYMLSSTSSTSVAGGTTTTTTGSPTTTSPGVGGETTSTIEEEEDSGSARSAGGSFAIVVLGFAFALA